MLTSQASFKWRLGRLHQERGIYYPARLTANETWKSMFEALFRQRHLWDADEQGPDEVKENENQVELRPLWMTRPGFITEENFNITVCVRFKPLKEVTSAIDDKAVLPLHQRLALIRASSGLRSNTEALYVLRQQGGWFKDKWADHENEKPSAQMREEGESSALSNEQDCSVLCGINDIDSKNARVVVVDATKGLREFAFDHVFSIDVSQDQVYDCSAARLVCDVVNGYNATCLVYGMTGSGKTFTMFGPSEKEMQDKFNASSRGSLEGIVPRTCREFFDAMEYRRQFLRLHFKATLTVSFVEIYGNDITDLLRNGTPCGHSKVSAQRFVLDGAADVPVKDTSDIMKLLKNGEAQRRKAATAMNERSSRAHSVFILTLHQHCVNTNQSKTSKLFLADLGGCEQTKKSKISAGKSSHVEALKQKTTSGDETTNAESASAMGVPNSNNEFSTGFVKSERMREAVYINLGLMSLKECVVALKSGPGAFVPYSNSKLASLLSSGLGGNSKTAIIVCAAQDRQHTSETVSALKFGQSCRKVSNTVKQNNGFIKNLICQLDEDILACEECIKKKERWEIREEKRMDDFVEKGTVKTSGFGGFEVRKTTVLVGAEEERLRLEKLLQRRAELTNVPLDNHIHSANFGGSVGFGDAHKYGLGVQFSVTEDKENYRFRETANEEHVPDVVKAKGVVKGWKTGDDIVEDSGSLERLAKTTNRSKSVYSGISA